MFLNAIFSDNKMSKIITPLLSHQKYLLDECIKKQPRVALFADLGVGKSLVALAVADKLDVGRILITADKTDSEITWPVQIESHTKFTYTIWKKTIERTDVEIFIVGYDYLKCILVFSKHGNLICG